MTSKLEFLAELPIFEALDEGELRALARICQEYEFDEGAVIAYQRDVADCMFIVRSGRLFARAVDERGIVRDTQAYTAGQYFDDTWLFTPGVHPATITATEGGQLITIKGSDFLQFLKQNPNALEDMAPEEVEDEDEDEEDEDEGEAKIGLSWEAWEEAQKSPLKADRRSAAISLLPDELVEFQARRSRWYLLLKVLVPALGLVLAPLLALALLTPPPGTPAGPARWIVPLLLAVFFGLWLVFQGLDWSNDYFVITNKQLAHHEFSLRTFRTTVNKVPIDQIQSVEVERPTFIANLFDFGTARITTAAQAGIIRFDNIGDPGQVEETLNRLRQQVQALDAGRAQESMRASIEDHFGVQPAFQPVEDVEDGEEDEEEEDTETETEEARSLLTVWRNFKKRYQWRVEEDGVITYRKHLFVLLKEVTWPGGIALLLIVAAVVLVRLSDTFNLMVVAFGLLLATIDFGWLIWQIEDWRNDIFQLTDRYVIDIDRRPFGFGESRKQAELSNVQNVNSDRPNILATIFNYGNVIIETAGATADITFENVSRPNVIQSEVFKRRDENRQRQLQREGDRRRKEYSVLLDVYQQAVEQGRIPRRTPPADDGNDNR